MSTTDWVLVALEGVIVVGFIALGVRTGGIGLGLWGGVGTLVLVFVFGLDPGEPPVDAMLIIIAVISAAVVILTAAYILWALQRVYLGAEYKGPHGEALTPMLPREFAIAVPLSIFAIVLGVYPQALLDYMQPSVDRQVQQLAVWTEEHDATQEALKKSLNKDGQQVAAAPLQPPAPPADEPQ